MKTYESGVIAPYILNLGPRWGWLVSFMLRWQRNFCPWWESNPSGL